jgi:drug/metabolite transporter (DMT)-like permease
MPNLKQNNIAGIGFAVINACMLGGMSLSAKWLGEYFDAIEVTFWRNLASVILLMAWLLAIRNLGIFKTKRPYAHLFRSAIGTVGIALGMYTVSKLSLAETTVLLFTSPLFTVIMSMMFLKEKVGVQRISAVVIGFIGVAIIALPGILDSNNLFPMIALATGLGWGFFSGAVDATLRWMGSTENTYTTTMYFLIFGTIACGLYWPFSATPIDSVPTNSWPTVLGIIALLGFTGTTALLSKTQSYRLGEASVIAPIMYTMLIWSAIFDYIFWTRTPGWNVILGATIIVGANLFILHREHVKSKVRETAGMPE